MNFFKNDSVNISVSVWSALIGYFNFQNIYLHMFPAVVNFLLRFFVILLE